MPWHHQPRNIDRQIPDFIAMLSTHVRIFIKEKIADLPLMNEQPLNLSVLKLLFARSHPCSAFGFQAMVILDTDYPQDITMSDGVDNAMDKGTDIANEGKVIDRGKL
jgi:hypothetical protein